MAGALVHGMHATATHVRGVYVTAPANMLSDHSEHDGHETGTYQRVVHGILSTYGRREGSRVPGRSPLKGDDQA